MKKWKKINEIKINQPKKDKLKKIRNKKIKQLSKKTKVKSEFSIKWQAWRKTSKVFLNKTKKRRPVKVMKQLNNFSFQKESKQPLIFGLGWWLEGMLLHFFWEKEWFTI